MTRPLLLVTRPLEEAARTVSAATEAGFDTLPAPLLRIEPLVWQPPAMLPDAILFTSGRSPALVAAIWPEARACPAYAVGARTAELAADAGFRLAAIGNDDGSAVLARAGGAGVRSVWHAAGEATAVLDVPPGIQLTRTPVYAARRVERLPADAIRALAGDDWTATLLFSARSARHFADLHDAAGLRRDTARLVALSPAIAGAAGPGWGGVAVAAAPGLAQALAAARSLWQSKGDD